MVDKDMRISTQGAYGIKGSFGDCVGTITDLTVPENNNVKLSWKPIVNKPEDFTQYASGAVKDNKGKDRTDLVPGEAMIIMARTLGYGCTEGDYGENNWRAGYPLMQTYASIIRHLMAWVMGITVDSKSGLPHSYHILTNAMILAVQEFNGRTDLDDRYKAK